MERPPEWIKIQVVLFSARSGAGATKRLRNNNNNNNNKRSWAGSDASVEVLLHGLPHVTFVTPLDDLDTVRRRIQRRMSPAVNLAECRAAVIDHSDMAEFFAPEVDSAAAAAEKEEEEEEKRTAADCAAASSSPERQQQRNGEAVGSPPSIVVPDELGGTNQDAADTDMNADASLPPTPSKDGKTRFYKKITRVHRILSNERWRTDMGLPMVGFELKGKILAPRAKRQRRAEGGISIRC